MLAPQVMVPLPPPLTLKAEAEAAPVMEPPVVPHVPVTPVRLTLPAVAQAPPVPAMVKVPVLPDPGAMFTPVAPPVMLMLWKVMFEAPILMPLRLTPVVAAASALVLMVLFALVMFSVLPVPLASMALPLVVVMVSIPLMVVVGVPVLPWMVNAVLAPVFSARAPKADGVLKRKTGEPAALLLISMPLTVLPSARVTASPFTPRLVMVGPVPFPVPVFRMRLLTISAEPEPWKIWLFFRVMPASWPVVPLPR